MEPNGLEGIVPSTPTLPQAPLTGSKAHYGRRALASLEGNQGVRFHQLSAQLQGGLLYKQQIRANDGGTAL